MCEQLTGSLHRPQSVCLTKGSETERSGSELTGWTDNIPSCTGLCVKPCLAVDAITQQEERCANANTFYCVSNVSNKIYQ